MNEIHAVWGAKITHDRGMLINSLWRRLLCCHPANWSFFQILSGSSSILAICPRQNKPIIIALCQCVNILQLQHQRKIHKCAQRQEKKENGGCLLCMDFCCALLLSAEHAHYCLEDHFYASIKCMNLCTDNEPATDKEWSFA